MLGTTATGGSRAWQERVWRRRGLYKLGLKMEEYVKYLESQYWQEVRKSELKEQAKERGYNYCEKCGATPNDVTRETALHVHHKTYERLGEERLEDLMIICRTCHEKEHGHGARRHYGPEVPIWLEAK
jgi:5-methylcytosine-specific restriction endonuclease McrA